MLNIEKLFVIFIDSIFHAEPGTNSFKNLKETKILILFSEKVGDRKN